MENKEGERFKSLLVIVTGMAVFYLLTKRTYFLYLSVGVGCLSLAIPVVAKGILWLWTKIGEVLGWVNSRILLGVVFYLFLTPIAWLSKLFRKDGLNLKDDGLDTLFKPRDHLYVSEDIENPW